jgi:hypothetical protein
MSHGPHVLGYLMLGFYSPYLKNVLEMVSLGWQMDIKPNKHVLIVC